jgi:RNA polymerase sigma-70 factor (ECF subfamily)
MRASQPPLQDPEAFSNLYEHTQIIIFRFIYGLHSGPIEDVEDLTCDTFLRAWKGRGRFWGDDNDAMCWLFTIARHLVIDTHRRKKSHPKDNSVELDETIINAMYLSTQLSPEEQTSRREQFKHLWQILQNLPDDKREVMVLRFTLGWKVNQIAKYLNKEENTVSVIIKRCLEEIRHEWSQIEWRNGK